MKADELWEKYWDTQEMLGDKVIGKESFLAALTEYGEHVRAEAVKVCMDRSAKHDNADRCETAWVLAAAIQKMELP